MKSDRAILASFSSLWCEQKNDYVLLKVEGTDRTTTDGCLIRNVREHSTLIIEDEEVNQDVMGKMRNAGVPVVFKNELPPGKNELEKMINEMLDAGKTAREVNAAIKAFESRKSEKH
jgi:hypothetical protein